MGHLQIKNITYASDNSIITQLLDPILRSDEDGIIAFDMQGTIIAVNDKAAQFLGHTPNALINHYPWQLFKLASFTRKRLFIQARACFLAAQNGLSQQFVWLECLGKKPALAYNIMINKAEIHGTSIIFAKLTDVLQIKINEWALWSLARISNHHEINQVIDEILKLLSEIFSADYAAVSLIDGQGTTHAVSYYYDGEKKENINFPFTKSAYNQIALQKSISYFNDIQHQFPQDDLLNTLHIKLCLTGAIINAQNDVVGLMSLLTKQTVTINKQSHILFGLFLDRMNLEIERLLNHRKLQFLASIPQQDPNPIIRILPAGDVVFANNQGKIVLKHWMDKYSSLPKQLLKEARTAQTINQVVRIEMAVDNKIYLFTLIWVEEFKQINIYGTDISQLKATEQDVLNLARFDSLTQIPNRQYFEEQLIEKMYEHRINAQHMALLLIDLDDFKIINDTLGHPTGDRLLQETTKRMARCLRTEDLLARLGGDEFIILVQKSDQSSAIKVAQKIITVLAKTFQFGEYHMNITASIGIALYPKTGISASELLKHADIAMYEAKKMGKNRYTVFSKSLHSIKDKRNEIIRKELKLAVAKNELSVEYQPQIDIIANKITGVEAYLRWHHPEQGLILPSEFIPIAEQTGCINLISQWLIKQSLYDYATFLSSHSDMKLSINVSLSQLNDPDFLDELTNHLQMYQINKHKIILDISERTIASHFKQISKSMNQIHAAGIKICLDNFGSPQMSLPKLLALPLNYLKLDQQLLVGIEQNDKHRMLLKGILQLTKELHIETIQKGIETEEEHLIMKSLGCRYAQGFYYCKPITINALRDFIQQPIMVP